MIKFDDQFNCLFDWLSFFNACSALRLIEDYYALFLTGAKAWPIIQNQLFKTKISKI